MPPIVDIFRALADPTRLRIFALLRSMELSVGELAQVLGQSQPRVSRHVKILCDAGLASRRKEGSWVFLAPAPSALALPLFALLDTARDAEGDHWTRADTARLEAVRADRAAAAARYFAEHAEHWDALRTLHVADSDVELAMARLLGDGLGRLVDLGTGTGRMIELFGGKASESIGIDRSPEMLRLARAKLDAANVSGWSLRQGDVAKVPVADRGADTVIIHQVLHYLPSPEVAIAEAARIVSDDGRLLIVDFASHDREELRLQDAHARLGFSDEQIEHWLAAAGLGLQQVETLKGTALTVKLWLAGRVATRKVMAA